LHEDRFYGMQTNYEIYYHHFHRINYKGKRIQYTLEHLCANTQFVYIEWERERDYGF